MGASSFFLPSFDCRLSQASPTDSPVGCLLHGSASEREVSKSQCLTVTLMRTGVSCTYVCLTVQPLSM